MYAKRTQWDLNPNPLSVKLEAFRKEGISYLDLTVSNPTQCRLDFPADDILSCFRQPDDLNYEPEPKGMLKARQSVCEFYSARGYSLDPDQMILTASTSEAYSFLFKLLADPGNEILIPTPSYPLFDYLAGLNDVRLRPYQLFYDNHWCLDVQTLRDNITPLTKALILVNPNNPTGSSFSEIEYREIINICKDYQLALISDEVFMDFPFEGESLKSFLAESEVLCFVLGGLSKTLALPQMKLSWIYASGPESFLRESLSRLELIADTYLSVNTPIQNALPKLLALSGPIQSMIQSRISQNRNLIFDFLQRVPEVDYLQAQGGWSAILRIPWGLDEDKFTLTLLDKDEVYVHPGYFFDISGNRSVVLSLLTDVKNMHRGLEILGKRIEGFVESRGK